MRMASISSKYGDTEICAYGKGGLPLNFWFYVKNVDGWQEFDIRELFRKVSEKWPEWADPSFKNSNCRRIDMVSKWIEDNRTALGWTNSATAEYRPARGKMLARIVQGGKIICVFKTPPSDEQGHAMADALST